MTAQEERHIRDLVNAYSHTADTDRFRDFGDDIEITDCTHYYISECRFDSQLDKREVEKHEQPYTGSSLKALTVTSLSQVDRWRFEMGPLSRGRFQNTTDHLTVPGSEYVETCHTCRGDGKENCPTCTGKGRRKGYHKCPLTCRTKTTHIVLNEFIYCLILFCLYREKISISTESCISGIGKRLKKGLVTIDYLRKA